MFLTSFSNPILNFIWAIILTPNLENNSSKAACRGLTKIVRKTKRFGSVINFENPPTPPGVEHVKLRAQFTNLMPVVYSLAIYSPAIY